jgi:hypothetical protein
MGLGVGASSSAEFKVRTTGHVDAQMAASSTSALDTSFVIVNQEFGVSQQPKSEPPTLPAVQEEDVKVRVVPFWV